MTEQNFSNHSKYVPAFHFFAGLIRFSEERAMRYSGSRTYTLTMRARAASA